MPDHFGGFLRIEVEFAGQEVEEQFHQPHERDAVGAPDARMQPFVPPHEGVKGRTVAAPDQRRAADEVPAVARQIPVARETAQRLHGGKINQPVLENFVRRMRVIDHLPFGVVPDDGSAAQPLEDADLDFVRAECEQPVKARGKTLDGLARQAGNQIGVEVDAGLAAEKAEVIFEPPIILAAVDQGGGLLVKGLDSDLELERAGREPGNRFPQVLGQMVRHHLEMEEMAGLAAFEAEFEDSSASVDIEVEGAVNKLELPRAAVEQALQSIK